MRIEIHFRILLLCCMLFVVCACGEQPVPKGVISEDSMVEFLSDAYMLEGFYAVESGSRISDFQPEIAESYQELFDSYGITQEDFDRSMDYYVRHPKRYEKIHAEVVRRLDEKMQ